MVHYLVKKNRQAKINIKNAKDICYLKFIMGNTEMSMKIRSCFLSMRKAVPWANKIIIDATITIDDVVGLKNGFVRGVRTLCVSSYQYFRRLNK